MHPRFTWLGLSVERSLRRVRELSARGLRPTTIEPLVLTSPLGHPLPCRLHLPAGVAPFPAVFLCPGGLDGAGGVEGLSPVLTAPRLARAGFAALAWTPSGREGAAGPEDRNGPLHQAEALRALQLLAGHPHADADRIVVLSISFGLVLALGALGQPDAPPVRALIDWEGPPSRAWFVSSRLRASTSDPNAWTGRDAIHLIHRLRAPYWRFQSRWDHVHGPDNTLGAEMVSAAVAAGLDEVRYNGALAGEPHREGPVSVAAQGELLLGWVRALLAG